MFLAMFSFFGHLSLDIHLERVLLRKKVCFHCKDCFIKGHFQIPDILSWRLNSSPWLGRSTRTTSYTKTHNMGKRFPRVMFHRIIRKVRGYCGSKAKDLNMSMRTKGAGGNLMKLIHQIQRHVRILSLCARE